MYAVFFTEVNYLTFLVVEECLFILLLQSTGILDNYFYLFTLPPLSVNSKNKNVKPTQNDCTRGLCYICGLPTTSLFIYSVLKAINMQH